MVFQWFCDWRLAEVFREQIWRARVEERPMDERWRSCVCVCWEKGKGSPLLHAEMQSFRGELVGSAQIDVPDCVH